MAKDAKRVQFGQRLRELREGKEMSRKQLADGMGLSERAVIQWELGEREPGWFNVLALAQALSVSVEAFTVEPSPAEPQGRGRPRKTGEKDESKSKRMDKKLPPDGTRVAALTFPSEEHDRPAREVRGPLQTRRVPFGIQCCVGGELVDENTVRPIDVDEGKTKRTGKRTKGKR